MPLVSQRLAVLAAALNDIPLTALQKLVLRTLAAPVLVFWKLSLLLLKVGLVRDYTRGQLTYCFAVQPLYCCKVRFQTSEVVNKVGSK